MMNAIEGQFFFFFWGESFGFVFGLVFGFDVEAKSMQAQMIVMIAIEGKFCILVKHH